MLNKNVCKQCWQRYTSYPKMEHFENVWNRIETAWNNEEIVVCPSQIDDWNCGTYSIHDNPHPNCHFSAEHIVSK